jgi:glutamyl-tRNA synthetase
MSNLVPIKRDCPVGRYAPSPTGRLHLGNLRTALAAWQECRHNKGIFILRVEDLDLPRTVAGAEEKLIEDLRWLGIDWDEGPDTGGPAGPYRQSERSEIYEAALEKLEERSLIFPCTCSRRELRAASAPHIGEEGPPYPGTCRNRNPRRQENHPSGAAARLNIRGFAPIEFTDLQLGLQSIELKHLCGDFIVRRRDGLWAYQLACAIDDALMGVTHVTRGADLLSSTPRQLAIIRLLHLHEPEYTHLPLVVDEQGRRMCKRIDSCSLDSLRNAGMKPKQAREFIMNLPVLTPVRGNKASIR